MILKANPVGIDIAIQGLQKHLNTNLTTWGLEIFGRAEVKEKKPLVFVSNNDYRDALIFSDKVAGRVFFVENTTTKSRSLSKTEIDVIFLLNVVKIFPDITHRADEELRVAIYNVLIKKFNRAEITITKGIDALDGFETKLVDMQPYHFLKFSFEVSYNLKNKC